ncbi:MAG: hypothetical protein JJ896_00135 [Rhodothermales bacterium]|nr:hypothetical protein [Rhodothermales bacterium]MBO6778034.1 hypothetical protein [Rhodothermales bacterium]
MAFFPQTPGRLGLAAGFLSALLTVAPAAAQQSHWQLYGANEGLSQQTAQAFFQDSRGYLWVGTRAGLNRFDGADFTVFGVRQGLENDWINDITEDEYGVIWVGTNNGLSRWTEKDGFSHVGVEQGLPEKVVTNVASDGKGGLWVATAAGLSRWDGDTWTTFGDNSELAAAGAVVSFARAPDGLLYIGTTNGVWVHDGSRFLPVAEDRAGGRAVLGLDAGVDGTVWFSTGRTIHAVQEGRPTHQIDAPAGLTILNVAACDDGTAWVRTNRGVAHVRPNGLTEYSVQSGVPILTVISVFQDREGLLWVGGIGGIAKFIGRAFTNYTQTEGLGSNTVWQISRGPEGDLWVGTTSGLSRFDGDEWRTYTSVDGLAGAFVRTVMVDRAGTMWVGSIGGLAKRTGDHTFEVLPQIQPFGEVFWIVEDQDDRLWISTRTGGLLRESAEEADVFERVNVPGQRFSNSRMLVSATGELWASGDNGMSRWDGNAWHTYTQADGMPANEPYFLAEDHDGSIWFGYHSSRGVTRFDGVNFTTYTSADGLSSDAVYSVGVDHRNHVWVGTSAGVDRWDGERFVSLTQEDGFVGSEANAGSFLADADGTLWLGAIGGLSHYNPRWDPSRGSAPTVELGALRNEQGDPVTGSLSATGNQGQIHLPVHVLSQVNRAQIDVRFRLTARANNVLPSFFAATPPPAPWRSLTAPELTFNNLNPGSYEVEVQARKYRGEWSEPASLFLSVAPPYWQRWWFILMAAAFLAFVARGVLQWKLGRVRAQNEWLENHIRELEEADRIKNEFLSNMSHEIRTPIAGILGFTSVLREELEGPHLEFIDHIGASASRLQRTLNSVLELAQLKNDRLRIDLSPVVVGDEVRAAIDAMQSAALEKSLALTYTDQSGGAQAYSHPDHLARILDILVYNAVKFTEDGEVSVRIENDEQYVMLTVRDTGIGISEEFLPQLFEPFQQASTGANRTHEGNGLGLSITRRLVDLMGGTIEVESTLGEGSQFTVRLARVIEQPLAPPAGPRPPKSARPGRSTLKRETR